MLVKRGDIWLVNLEPTIGAEINKTRPCVIIQNDIGNAHSPFTIIAPLTTKKLEVVRNFEVFVSKKAGIDADSKALLNQIRSIDKKRLMERIGHVDDETMGIIDEAIKISLGLLPIS